MRSDTAKVILLLVAAGLTLAAGAPALAFDVAVIPAGGEATKEKLAAFDAAVNAALASGGHNVTGPGDTAQVLKKMALKGVESLQDAELVAIKLKVQFVVTSQLTPMAGQDSMEIKAYFIPEGRVELLEEVAAEGEMGLVVAGMLQRLLTKDGLFGGKKPGVAGPPPPPVGGSEGTGGKEGGAGGPGGAAPGEGAPTGPADAAEDKSEDQKLVEDLQPLPKKKRLGYGADFRVALELLGGASALLTTPRAVGRAGGNVSLAVGYVLVPAYGCEVGGEIRTYFGSGDGFSLAPYAGFNFRLSPKVPAYAGGRLSVGFFKGITGAKPNQMLVRASLGLTFVFVGRYMLMIDPAAFTILAFGGRTAAFYDGGLGFGIRF